MITIAWYYLCYKTWILEQNDKDTVLLLAGFFTIFTGILDIILIHSLV